MGTPLSPLPDHARAGRLELPRRTPGVTIAGLPFEIEVIAENRSTSVWPVMAPGPAHVVMLGTRWRTPDGAPVAEDPTAGTLPFDVAPGEQARGRVGVVAPSGHDRLVLEIGLTQDGSWFPDPIQATLKVKPRAAGPR